MKRNQRQKEKEARYWRRAAETKTAEAKRWKAYAKDWIKRALAAEAELVVLETKNYAKAA